MTHRRGADRQTEAIAPWLPIMSEGTWLAQDSAFRDHRKSLGHPRSDLTAMAREFMRLVARRGGLLRGCVSRADGSSRVLPASGRCQ